jgi:hypothetical protein
VPRLRRRERKRLARDLWWELFNANRAIRFSNGQRDYVEQLTLAVHDAHPLLNRAHIHFLCRRVWEAAIYG